MVDDRAQRFSTPAPFRLTLISAVPVRQLIFRNLARVFFISGRPQKMMRTLARECVNYGLVCHLLFIPVLHHTPFIPARKDILIPGKRISFSDSLKRRLGMCPSQLLRLKECHLRPYTASCLLPHRDVQILVVDYKGHSRAVAIGRLKVETRPMVMVEFESETLKYG